MRSILRSNIALLLATAITLLAGLIAKYLFHSEIATYIWAFGGLLGLIPSLIWLIDELRDKQMGSDILALLGIIGTLVTQEFFAASMISLMLATGRNLESWAQGQALRQLSNLVSRIPKIAHRVDSDSVIRDVAINQIEVGDRLLVKSGEIVPADGSALSAAILDQSALTGEPLPVELTPGSEVLSGVVNAGLPLEMVVTRLPEESTYAGIVKLVSAAQKIQSHDIRIANTWALRFVPVALVLAIGAWIATGDPKRMVAVLVVATPCPLILAVPIALVAGMSRAARFGSIIKGGAALEKLARAKTVLLDKTGTLTYGGPTVTKILSAPGFSEEEVLHFAASLDQYSPHIIAKAIVERGKARGTVLSLATEVEEIHGKGISGVVAGKRIRIGKVANNAPDWSSGEFSLRVGIFADEILIGVIGLNDPIRTDAEHTIKKLRQIGISRILLVTGDRMETAQKVGGELGIDEIFASASPQDKQSITMSEKKQTFGTVIVVGDGINDAPALAAADVGVAMGARGATAASEAADVVIVEDSIKHLASAIGISKFSRRRASQAAGIGMILSLVAMASAGLGFLTPSQGALLQELIDLIAILWAMTVLSAKA